MTLKTKILLPTVVLIALSIIVSTVISYTSVKRTIFWWGLRGPNRPPGPWP